MIELKVFYREIWVLNELLLADGIDVGLYIGIDILDLLDHLIVNLFILV
jgi:hypothetical protein